jgi:hypothetical protein
VLAVVMQKTVEGSRPLRALRRGEGGGGAAGERVTWSELPHG